MNLIPSVLSEDIPVVTKYKGGPQVLLRSTRSVHVLNMHVGDDCKQSVNRCDSLSLDICCKQHNGHNVSPPFGRPNTVKEKKVLETF